MVLQNSKIVKYNIGRGFHAGECKQFFAEVFYGCSNMVKGIVNNQKSIMYSVGCFYLNGCILTIVPFNALSESSADLSGIYQSGNVSISIIELN